MLLAPRKTSTWTSPTKMVAIELGCFPNNEGGLARCLSGPVNRTTMGLDLKRTAAYAVLRSMNPNYLLKDEFQYELSARGISTDSDVHLLRRLFRSLVAEKVPVDLRNLRTPSVEELYERIVNKTLELQVLITQQKSELALLTPRFRTRLSPEWTLAAFDGVGPQSVGHHDLEVSTST